jgi:hypothetical protein
MGIVYEGVCNENRIRNSKELAVAFIASMLMVLFVPTWTLRFQMWGVLIALYFALIM